MIPVKASSFGRRIGCARRYPGGRRYRHLRPAISGRPAVPQHLAHRLAGQPKATRGRALAQSLHIDAAPHRRIELHSIHPSCVPQNTLGMLGGPPTRSGFPPPAGRVSPRRAVVYSCSAVLTRLRGTSPRDEGFRREASPRLSRGVQKAARAAARPWLQAPTAPRAAATDIRRPEDHQRLLNRFTEG